MDVLNLQRASPGFGGQIRQSKIRTQCRLMNTLQSQNAKSEPVEALLRRNQDFFFVGSQWLLTREVCSMTWEYHSVFFVLVRVGLALYLVSWSSQGSHEHCTGDPRACSP